MGWEIHAPSLTQTLLTTASRLPGVPLYVTENGAAFDDTVTETGIHDENRVDYYASHISAALDARRPGGRFTGLFRLVAF